MWLAFAIIIILIFCISVKMFAPKKNRNQFNKLPVGNLRKPSETFGNKVTDLWIPQVLCGYNDPI